MKLKAKTQQIVTLLILGILVVGLAVTIILVQRRQEIRKQATSNSVTLSLQPSTYNFALNETRVVELWATFTGGSASEKLNYFKTEISFPNTYFEVADLIDVTPSGLNQIFRVDLPSTANQTGKIIIQIGAVTNNDIRPSTNTAMRMAYITFRAKQSTPAAQPFTINKTITEVVNNDSPDPVQIPVNDPQNAQYSVGAGATNTPIPTGSCAPPPAPVITTMGCFLSTTVTNQRVRTIWQAPTVPVGCELDSYMSSDPVTHHPYELEVDDDPTFPHNFDPTFIGTTVDNYYANYLGTTDSTSQTAFFSSSPTLPKRVYARVRAMNKFGQLSNWSTVDSFVVGPNTCTANGLPNSDLMKVGTINFRVKTGVTGTAPVDFRLTPESFVIEQNTAADILGTTTGLNFIISGVGVTGTPIPTITAAPGAPIISFNVKFRDINVDIGSPVAIVRVKKDTFFKEFSNITLTHAGSGVYTASGVALNGVPAGSGYKLYVKGPKHLARGFDNINLVAGNNGPFDWTGESLEPGDLPPQDGVINSSDISRLVEMLDNPTFTQTDLDEADLNYDGTINGGDVNELIRTLEEKFDEDRY